MHSDASTEYDSSSSCVSSPGGDTPASVDSLCSASSMDSKDAETGAPDSFVPTVTAISTSPDLNWMVQPTVLTAVSPSPGRAKSTKANNAVHSSSTAGSSKAQPSARKAQKDQPTKEEDERKRIRRERNKIAAAKCRNRRRELTDTLQAETDQLEDDKAALQAEIADLLKEKERLEQILASHKPNCKLPSDDEDHGGGGGGGSEDEVEAMLEDPPSSPQLLSMLDNVRTPGCGAATPEAPMAPDVDVAPCISAAAILGNSNILLCSSAEEEPLEDLKDDLDDLVPSLEVAVAADSAVSVPDIDLNGPFCLSDWENLYKSVANDLDPLSTPIMSSSPTCSNFRSVFSFNYPELDSLADGCEALKAGLGGSEFSKDSLNSPTLLAL